MTEDVSVDVNGDLVASGQLAITDDDAGEAFFRGTVPGAHGSLDRRMVRGRTGG